MRVGSLFAGIGGFDLGLAWAGYDIAWQVEEDEWCRKVLAKHWPDVARFTDVRDCGLHNLEPVDVICGGFPCQDISLAGRQAGLDGERSSLWWEMRRIVGELRPPYVIVENVPNLFIRGFDRVLGSLSEIGYDAEWGVISANDVGAPHLRQRLWIVAYPASVGSGGVTGKLRTEDERQAQERQEERVPESDESSKSQGTGGAVAYPAGARGEARDGDPLGNGNGSYRHQGVAAGQGGEGGASAMAYPHGDDRRGASGPVSCGRHPRVEHRRGDTGLNVSEPAEELAHTSGPRLEGHTGDVSHSNEPGRVASGPDGSTTDAGLYERTRWHHSGWVAEPNVGRVAHGVSKRVDRLRGIGNAIVPQIAYWLGTRIKDAQ